MTEELINSKLEFLESLAESSRSKNMDARGVAMVIDGKTLGFALDGGALSNSLLKLTESCTSVLCVRATPFQKAAVVKLVRDRSHKLTLAIGKCHG